MFYVSYAYNNFVYTAKKSEIKKLGNAYVGAVRGLTRTITIKNDTVDNTADSAMLNKSEFINACLYSVLKMPARQGNL